MGGTSGIGAAIGNALARCGARVTVTGASAREVDAARRAPVSGPPRRACSTCATRGAVRECIDALPQLDMLVNCAGIIRRGDEHDPEVFDEVIDVNLNGTMRDVRVARALLASSRGCIVNTASMYSFFGGPHAPGYTASKGGVAQLTKSLAVAYAGDGDTRQRHRAGLDRYAAHRGRAQRRTEKRRHPCAHAARTMGQTRTMSPASSCSCARQRPLS